MDRVEKIIAISKDIGSPLSKSDRVLDLGCGAGNQVQRFCELGYDCFGGDINFKDGKYVSNLQEDHRILKIEMNPYKLAFPDNHFDFVFSDQVFEHVQDYDGTLQELSRVLKPDGWSMHIFPAQWRVLEAHIGTPFAGKIKNSSWIKLWARLGLNRRNREVKDWQKVAELDYDYLISCTHYLRRTEIRESFEKNGFSIQHIEGNAMRYSKSILVRAGRFMPMIPRAVSHFGARVICAAIKNKRR